MQNDVHQSQTSVTRKVKYLHLFNPRLFCAYVADLYQMIRPLGVIFLKGIALH